MERLVAPLFRVWAATWRRRERGWKFLAEAKRQHPAVILATWHGSLSGFVYSMRDRGIIGLVSPVWEGELIARWLLGMGYGLVRGSSNHQSTEGLRASVRMLKEGNDVGSVVDGPEGPATEIKMGVISMAKLSGVPILPALAAASHSYRFPSWDRHELPLPFARVHFRIAEPLSVPRNATPEQMEELRLTLERRMIELDRELREELHGSAK